MESVSVSGKKYFPKHDISWFPQALKVSESDVGKKIFIKNKKSFRHLATVIWKCLNCLFKHGVQVLHKALVLLFRKSFMAFKRSSISPFFLDLWSRPSHHSFLTPLKYVEQHLLLHDIIIIIIIIITSEYFYRIKVSVLYKYNQTCSNDHLYKTTTHLKRPMLSPPKQISI